MRKDINMQGDIKFKHNVEKHTWLVIILVWDGMGLKHTMIM